MTSTATKTSKSDSEMVTQKVKHTPQILSITVNNHLLQNQEKDIMRGIHTTYKACIYSSVSEKENINNILCVALFLSMLSGKT